MHYIIRQGDNGELVFNDEAESALAALNALMDEWQFAHYVPNDGDPEWVSWGEVYGERDSLWATFTNTTLYVDLCTDGRPTRKQATALTEACRYAFDQPHDANLAFTGLEVRAVVGSTDWEVLMGVQESGEFAGDHTFSVVVATDGSERSEEVN